MWRFLYHKTKNKKQHVLLESLLDNFSYTCGFLLQDVSRTLNMYMYVTSIAMNRYKHYYLAEYDPVCI